ncbi:MAG: alanine racemase, partial [Candidatus Anstonellales archaeon]
ELNFFVQIDYTNKEHRNGLKEEEVLEFLDFCESLQLRVIGLMTYPLPEEEEFAYSKLHHLKNKIENEKKIKLKISAGTSSDFKIAIKYGTNYLRIGRAIFDDYC